MLKQGPYRTPPIRLYTYACVRCADFGLESATRTVEAPRRKDADRLIRTERTMYGDHWTYMNNDHAHGWVCPGCAAHIRRYNRRLAAELREDRRAKRSQS